MEYMKKFLTILYILIYSISLHCARLKIKGKICDASVFIQHAKCRSSKTLPRHISHVLTLHKEHPEFFSRNEQNDWSCLNPKDIVLSLQKKKSLNKIEAAVLKTLTTRFNFTSL